MSSPTTAETPTMRERLARALLIHDLTVLSSLGWPTPNETWEVSSTERRESYCGQVDAILREMLEPSEGMITAAGKVRTSDRRPGNPNNYRVRRREYWQAMIQHILNETQD